MRTIHAKSNRSLLRQAHAQVQKYCASHARSGYFWHHSSKLDTAVNQNSHAAPIRSPIRGRTGFWKSRGFRASVPFFPLPLPAPSTFLLSPHFPRGPSAKTSFARPEFRWHCSGTLGTQAKITEELLTICCLTNVHPTYTALHYLTYMIQYVTLLTYSKLYFLLTQITCSIRRIDILVSKLNLI